MSDEKLIQELKFLLQCKEAVDKAEVIIDDHIWTSADEPSDWAKGASNLAVRLKIAMRDCFTVKDNG